MWAYLGDARGQCRCTAEQVQRYRGRLSGPLLDRLDLHIDVPRVATELMQSKSSDIEASASVAARVHAARQLQHARQAVTNSRLNNRQVERFCKPTRAALALLERAAQTLGLSARAYHRILKVARTIADLAHTERIDVDHVGEAMALRRLDRRS